MSKQGLEAFLVRTLSSDLLADALAMFRSNPGLVDTPDAIARRLGTSSKKFGVELTAMKKVGLLREESIGSFRIISYDSSAEGLVSDFVGKKLAEKPRPRGKPR